MFLIGLCLRWGGVFYLDLFACFLADGEGGDWELEGAHGIKPICNCQVSGTSVQGRLASQLQEDFVQSAAQHDKAGQGVQDQKLL